MTRLLGGEEGYAVIAEATGAQAYRIDGMGTGDKSAGIHGFPVLSGPVAVDAATAGKLAAVLTADDTYLWDISKACEFMPGVAVRYAAGGHKMDVLICFSCDELEVYLDGKRVGHEDFDPKRSQLVGVAQALFPDDPAIQKLR